MKFPYPARLPAPTPPSPNLVQDGVRPGVSQDTLEPQAAPAGSYEDRPPGAEYALPGTPLTVDVSRIDTDIARREAACPPPGFGTGQDGMGSIAGSTFPASPTAAF